MKQKFEPADYPAYLYRFLNRILVRCPRCDRCATIIPIAKNPAEGQANVAPGNVGSVLWTDLVFSPRRLVCDSCGYNKDWQGKKVAGKELRDGYFNQPLWLQTPCCGETLWAYNEEHLSFLRDYVGADLREGGITGNGTLVSRLPLWLKSAKNREDVLRCIAKLRETLVAP